MDYGASNLKCLKLYEKNISYNKEKKILNLHYYTIDFIDFNALFDKWIKQVNSANSSSYVLSLF